MTKRTMTGEFSHLIYDARINMPADHRSQSSIARATGIPQTTLSSWERGLQLPLPESPDDRNNVMVKLAEALHLTVEELTSALISQRARRNTPKKEQIYNSTDILSLDVQSYVESEYGTGNVDVWIIGPSQLALVNNIELQNTWIKNILAGTNYNIIWFLDAVDTSHFRELAAALASIQENVCDQKRKKTGKINHYATHILWKVSLRDLSLQYYMTTKRMIENLPCEENMIVNKFFDYNCFESAESENDGDEQRQDTSAGSGWVDLSNWRKHVLLMWQEHSSIVIYLPRKIEKKPCAIYRSRPVLHSQSDTSNIRPMFWFLDEDVSQLVFLTNFFQRCVEDSLEVAS